MTETKVQIFINIGQARAFCNFVLCQFNPFKQSGFVERGVSSLPLNSFSAPLWHVKQQKYTHLTQNVVFYLSLVFLIQCRGEKLHLVTLILFQCAPHLGESMWEGLREEYSKYVFQCFPSLRNNNPP